MIKLPYTYIDTYGDYLVVSADGISVHNPTKDADAGVHTPTGDEAVALIQAFYKAAGVTGYKVLSVEEIEKIHRASELRGAVSMRERIADAMEVEYGLLAARFVETMPLLPDCTDLDTH